MTWLRVRRSRKSAFFILAPLLAVLAALHLAQAPQVVNSATPILVLEPPRYPFTFVGYGDTRFTNPGDALNSNAAARQALVERIADEKPQFLVINGDLVFHGGNADDWAVYDRETKKLREAGIKIFPVLGNHDLADSESGSLANHFRRFLRVFAKYDQRTGQSGPLANYFQRFPEIRGCRWYSLRAGNVLLFMLDTASEQKMGSAQRQWLDGSLSAVPRDVDFVVLVMHHPLYTKSSEHPSGEGHAARPQELSLAKMLEERQKTMRARMVVLAGHVHNYERYQYGGIMYIVSGGGGATPYFPQRSPGDFYAGTGATYHYCKFTADKGSLTFQMVKLDLDASTTNWTTKDSFQLMPR
jgi:3',5'-cyclic AMP phosphodiesterase CpdA